MNDVSWPWRARRFADGLRERGDLEDPAWHAAVAAVPRHELVPHVVRQDDRLRWVEVDTASPDGLDLVYSPTTLVTKVEKGRAVSSSTKPDLVVRMLEALAVDDADRVLQVGTGTGYTAALLAHRLGDEQVTSVDIDAELVSTARERLAYIGLHPRLVVGDGAHGEAGGAPYDRIVATCSVPRVPTAWLRQLRPGGLTLVSLMPSVTAGNLVLLRRDDDELRGRFSRRVGTFMPMRRDGASRPPSDSAPGPVAESRTAIAGEPWRDSPLPWLWTALDVPGLGHGYLLDDDGVVGGIRLDAADGSVAEVGGADASGVRSVVERGPTRLWAAFSRHHAHWCSLDRPGWERLGLTVTATAQTLWIDHPDSAHRWDVPAAS